MANEAESVKVKYRPRRKKSERTLRARHESSNNRAWRLPITYRFKILSSCFNFYNIQVGRKYGSYERCREGKSDDVFFGWTALPNIDFGVILSEGVALKGQIFSDRLSSTFIFSFVLTDSCDGRYFCEKLSLVTRWCEGFSICFAYWARNEGGLWCS